MRRNARMAVLAVAAGLTAASLPVQAADQDTRLQHSTAYLLSLQGSEIRVAAVVPPYLWLQAPVNGPIYVCRYNPNKPWEVSNKCTLLTALPTDLGP